MIPSALIARLKLLTDSTIQTTAPVREIQSDPPTLMPGERFRAVIQGAQTDGIFQAKVGSQTVNLALPMAAQTGDQLDLMVTSRSANVVTAHLVPTAPASASAPQLSSAAQLIGALLTGRDTGPVTLAAGQPLLQQPTTEAAQILPALRSAVSESGVFYEAHQAKWVSGQASTESLLREPQGKLSSARAATTMPAANVQPNVAAQSTVAAAAANAEQLAPNPPAGSSILTNDVAPIMHKQLDTLATQQLAWQAQLWPGQTMQWEIDAPFERDAREASTDAPDEWRTRLKLMLPRLGEVSAQISLSGDRVQLRIAAHDAATAQSLRAASAGLGEAFEAAGLRLDTALVQHDE